MSADEFAVWIYFPDETHLLERDRLPAKEAVELAKQCTERPAASIGMIAKVQIVDGDDFTVFMWEFGKGVTYPTKADGCHVSSR